MMVKGFYSRIVEALKANRSVFVRYGNGDHEIWYSPLTDRYFTVDKGRLSRHTANAVMKQAGLTSVFEPLSFAGLPASAHTAFRNQVPNYLANLPKRIGVSSTNYSEPP